MTPRSTLRHALARLLAVAGLGLAAAVPARAGDEREFAGYDAFYATLPDALFTAADKRSFGHEAFVDGHGGMTRRWAGEVDGRRHRVAVTGSLLEVDGRAFGQAHAVVFPRVLPADMGLDARLYVTARDVCVDGVAPTASGTSQRWRYVHFVQDAFGPHARRYELPGLFGSCLSLQRAAGGDVRFFEASLHTPDGADFPDSAVLQPWRLHRGRFVQDDGPALRAVFKAADDVYDFRIEAPAS
ncbi:MAG TPA: hypothetical protein VF453_15750 [Burkholderiaceae bacterium]